MSATTEKKVLFESEVRLPTDIVKLLSDRLSCGRTRRSRKTRYGKPRFSNGKRKRGWLPPFIHNKVDMHIKIVNLVTSILPIQNITVEVAQFDIQKIKNPDTQGEENTCVCKQVRCTNGQLYKNKALKGGVRKRNKAPYLVKGFGLFDQVRYQNQVCFIIGRRKTGYFYLRLLDGTKIYPSVSHKKLDFIELLKSLLMEVCYPVLLPRL